MTKFVVAFNRGAKYLEFLLVPVGVRGSVHCFSLKSRLIRQSIFFFCEWPHFAFNNCVQWMETHGKLQVELQVNDNSGALHIVIKWSNYHKNIVHFYKNLTLNWSFNVQLLIGRVEICECRQFRNHFTHNNDLWQTIIMTWQKKKNAKWIAIGRWKACNYSKLSRPKCLRQKSASDVSIHALDCIDGWKEERTHTKK